MFPPSLCATVSPAYRKARAAKQEVELQLNLVAHGRENPPLPPETDRNQEIRRLQEELARLWNEESYERSRAEQQLMDVAVQASWQNQRGRF